MPQQVKQNRNQGSPMNNTLNNPKKNEESQQPKTQQNQKDRSSDSHYQDAKKLDAKNLVDE